MSVTKRIDRPSGFGTVVPAGHVHVVRPVEAAPGLPLAEHKAPTACAVEPRISLIKDGDTVSAIEIVCTCGEIIRLECEY